MRFFSCLIFTFFLAVKLPAQHIHYIYIQTENKQAFYVNLNEKLMSSTTSGYLVIPKLTDGVYRLNIGFPKKEWPSQNVDIAISNKDEGFVLKNFGEKGWGLFNIQSMNILMGTAESTTSAFVPENKADVFSNTLADVTNTPSIKQADISSNPLVIDSLHDVVKPADSVMPIEIQPANITQLFSILDTSGRSTIYTIKDENAADTVRLFIPYENKNISPVKEVAAVKEEEINESKKQPDIILADSISKIDSTLITTSKPGNEIKKMDNGVEQKSASDITSFSITLVNPSCNVSATDQDFSRLQRKMAAAEDNEVKMALAKKSFKSKCFTTEQVKNLSALFSKDEEKYNFFDAAYGHVSDIGNFKELQSQLSDEYYINRFKAMLR